MDSTLIEVYSYGCENGTFYVYVNSETNPRKSYNLTNGYWDENEEDFLTITLNNLNINQEGVYNITTKFKLKNSDDEILLDKTEITYTYNPFTVYISNYLYTMDSTLIEVYSYGCENGTFYVYVNGETNPRKSYNLTNGYWYDDEDELTITLNDLNINQNGVYVIITKFKPNGGM